MQVGPLINARQRDRVAALVNDASERGVEVRAGGQRPEALPRGYFFEPTVLAGVTPGMPVFEEEIFGPVMPVTPFDEIDEALALANRTPYGLAAYVWTNDLRAAVKLSEGLEFGIVGVNEWAAACHRGAVRRLEAERPRTRERRRGPGRVPRNQARRGGRSGLRTPVLAPGRRGLARARHGLFC